MARGRIASYDDHKGVTVIEAKGASMSFARHYIRKSPMGPLADNVQAVTIMIMKKASSDVKGEFLPLLRKTMKSYNYALFTLRGSYPVSELRNWKQRRTSYLSQKLWPALTDALNTTMSEWMTKTDSAMSTIGL